MVLRWQAADAQVPRLAIPRWQGEPIDRRTILLWPEQGIGDAIQFVRYVAIVKQMGARVLLFCPASLAALFSEVPGVDRVVAMPPDDERVDFQAALMSLPALFGTTLETIPSTVPYLFAAPDRVAHLRERCARQGEFRVGIAWQGNPQFKLDKTLKREIEIDGQPYTVAISPEGVKLTQKGFRKGREMSWRQLWSGATGEGEGGGM